MSADVIAALGGKVAQRLAIPDGVERAQLDICPLVPQSSVIAGPPDIPLDLLCLRRADKVRTVLAGHEVVGKASGPSVQSHGDAPGITFVVSGRVILGERFQALYKLLAFAMVDLGRHIGAAIRGVQIGNLDGFAAEHLHAFRLAHVVRTRKNKAAPADLVRAVRIPLPARLVCERGLFRRASLGTARRLSRHKLQKFPLGKTLQDLL